MGRHGNAWLADDEVREIMARYARGLMPKEIAAAFNVPTHIVDCVVSRRTYRDVQIPTSVRVAVERRRRNSPRNQPRPGGRHPHQSPGTRQRNERPAVKSPEATSASVVALPTSTLDLRDQRVMSDLSYAQQMIVEAATYVGDDIIEVHDWCREAGDLLLDIAARMERRAQG